ncbi:MAG: putative pterin-4-alpha-carbinolamine dehydratase [Anaerolineales bacterium]|nr:putative pterin-4-alpha-carbinolamine dehydratase [Anaerolineales bacterium]WKZ48431.1 MAG: 4a-hydroxytetrahydrobiopterin dehydratase [Anaerolineales bacterium]
MKLSELKCVSCRGGDPALTEAEIAELLPQVSDWQIVVRDGIPHLERVFKFKNFVQALEFANKVGTTAEEEDHHPMLVVEWGRVGAHWWTHVVKGLHKNDFIMAAKTDEIFNLTNG